MQPANMQIEMRMVYNAAEAMAVLSEDSNPIRDWYGFYKSRKRANLSFIEARDMCSNIRSIQHIIDSPSWFAVNKLIGAWACYRGSNIEYPSRNWEKEEMEELQELDALQDGLKAVRFMKFMCDRVPTRLRGSVVLAANAVLAHTGVVYIPSVDWLKANPVENTEEYWGRSLQENCYTLDSYEKTLLYIDWELE